MKIEDLFKGPGRIARNVFGNQSEYHLQFNLEADNYWYVDFPNWPFSHHNLMMVAGADDLCDYMLHEGEDHIKVSVIPAGKREEHEGYAELECTDSSLTGGAHYKVNGIPDFQRNIWLCPVTLFVLGRYPRYIYFKQTA